MIPTFDNPEALAQSPDLEKASVIGIDGRDGVGKSTLADALGNILRIRVIHLDDYLERDKGAYVQHIRYEKISNEIQGNPKVLIEGVCLLQILRQLAVTADFLIYVKHMRHGMWADKDDLVPESTIEEHIQKLETDMYNGQRLLAHMDQAPPPDRSAVALTSLTREIVYYHAAYRPQAEANAEFHRTES